MSAARRAGLGRRLALLAAGLVLSVAIAEIVARASESLRGGHDLATQLGDRLEDPLLGYRPLPGSGDHDERGFRNESVPSGADVVALGDSQTWGVNAPIDQSWPAVLASETGLVVYNMRTGGYGPLHYRVLLDEALALDPRWIVIALFLGNDVHDCYELAYGQEAHRLPVGAVYS